MGSGMEWQFVRGDIYIQNNLLSQWNSAWPEVIGEVVSA